MNNQQEAHEPLYYVMCLELAQPILKPPHQLRLPDMADHLTQFKALVSKSPEDQAELFLKSFIFELGDDWVMVPRLCTRYKDYLKALGDGSTELNPVQASDFLQKEGSTRTASERKAELADIDLDANNMLALIELLLLVHKKMVLESYYKRVGGTPKVDLTGDGIGITGVGPELLEELFTFPVGLDPALEKAIADFMARKKGREDQMALLEKKSQEGGVKGLTAGNELAQLKAQDTTWLNKEELTLNAARKKASKNSGEEALRQKKAAEEAEAAAKRQESRNKLKAMASKFQ